MKAVSDGFNELTELKAIGRKRGEVTLTHVGRQLARIPIDVRLGRMVIEAAKSSTPDTLAAVLVIVAFLSLQDPRERPDEARDEADRIHNRYADPSSDYLTALNIWTVSSRPMASRATMRCAVSARASISAGCAYASGRTWSIS